MKRVIPVLPVSKEVIEQLQKARAGLVQERVWVKDSGKKKGHWRMQWVQPGNGKADATSGQIDLFGNPSKPTPAKTDEYKPAHPHLGEFVGHGLGDNRRDYEGYAGKDGSVKYYDKETGNELDEDGNMKNPDEKKQGGFETGKKYRHKTEGWEGEYIGHETRDIATNGKHKLADVPGFKITKPASDQNHYSNYSKEAWGDHKPEDFEDAPIKKSAIDLFRDNIAKAFGTLGR